MSFNWGEVSLGNSSFVDIDALIKEAKQRQRRRWKITGGIVVALMILAAGLSVATGGGTNHSPITSLSQSRSPSSGHASPNQNRSIAALASINPGYTELMVVRGRLYATDPSLPQGGCVTSPVNMKTYQIETKIVSPCPINNFASNGSGYLVNTAGETVTPQVSCNQKMTINSGSVQIAVTDPQTGKPTYGPVVMTYSCAVNTFDLEDAYGAGYLWIYDCETPNGSQLLEVSAITGVVEERLSMPHVCKTNVKANAEGFFLTESSEWFQPPKNTMYHVAPGTNNVVAIDSFTGGLSWSEMIGTDLWIEAPTSPATCTQLCEVDEIVRYVGADATPQVIARNLETNAYQPGPISGGGSDWVIQTTLKGKRQTTYVQSVVQINTTSGLVTKFGSFGNEILEPGAGNASLVYLHSAVFVLEGGQIYRIRV